MGAVVKTATATQYQVVLLSIAVAGRGAVLKLGLSVERLGMVVTVVVTVVMVMVVLSVKWATAVGLGRRTTGFVAIAMDQSIPNRQAHQYYSNSRKRLVVGSQVHVVDLQWTWNTSI
jgi:hypothetical protein